MFGRNGLQHYSTPEHVTRTLLDHVSFVGTVWEPACGRGAMAEVLRGAGLRVYCSDIHDYGYPMSAVGDFLRIRLRVANVVTNPPWRHTLPWVKHALRCAADKVAMLLPMQTLGLRLSQHVLSRVRLVLAFRRRPRFQTVDGWDAYSPPYEVGWFIWQPGHLGDTVIRWV